MEEVVVYEDKGGHGLDDGDGAGEDTRIVSAATLDFGIIAGDVDSFLGFEDC